ncbi:hypothetical protein BCF44_126110, partial [Kutzneria buriramensis]
MAVPYACLMSHDVGLARGPTQWFPQRSNLVHGWVQDAFALVIGCVHLVRPAGRAAIGLG